MTKIFGNFRETLPTDHEFLLLGFSSSSIPMQTRWRNNGLSANFIADYLTTFFPAKDDDHATHLHNHDVKSAVSYIANELLENAMKFNVDQAQCPIRFGLHLLDEDGGTIILSTTNSVASQSIQEFQKFIHELLTADVDELYIRQLENSAHDDVLSSSRLGLISMKSDYAAQLGWKFESLDDNGAIAVTTMVQLNLRTPQPLDQA